jgi:hypothetical protein
MPHQQQHVRLTQAQLGPIAERRVAQVHHEFIGALHAMEPLGGVLESTLGAYQLGAAGHLQVPHQRRCELRAAHARIMWQHCEGLGYGAPAAHLTLRRIQSLHHQARDAQQALRVQQHELLESLA